MSDESAKVEGGYSTEETLLAVVDAVNNITINEVATAADGGALPAVVKVIAGYDGTNVQVVSTDSSGRPNVNVNGTVPVSAVSLPLPSGAATGSRQDTGNVAVATLNGKVPAATGAVAAIADLVGAGNPNPGDFFAITTPFSGSRVFTFVSGAPANSQEIQLDPNPLVTVANIISAINVTFSSGELAATNPSPATIRLTAGSFYPGSVGNSLTLTESATNVSTANVGVGGVFTGGTDGTTALATGAKQDAGNASLSSIDGKTPAPVSGRVPVDGSGVTQPVSGPLTNTQLRASPVEIDQVYTGTFATQTNNGMAGDGSQRVVIASDNTPFATKTDLTTPGITNGVSLAYVNTTATAVGNGVVGAGVQRVAIASDNTAFSVNLGTIGSAATAANQTTANTSLSNIDTNTGRSPRNANATDSTNATVGTSAVSESAPADAVGFILSADPANTGLVVYRLGGTATTSSGHPLEASRDSGYMPVAVTISLISDTAAQKYNLTWIRR